MVESSRGLGRGLDALLGGSGGKEPVNRSEVRLIPLGEIRPNAFQPRREFDEQTLADLTASIKAQGVLQPVLVRPSKGGGFELVAGERRFRASGLAGLNDIPAIVRELTDEQSLAIALIENLQREDLNAIEEARGYRQLIEEFGLSQEALATQVGKSRSAVANALRLLKLPDVVQDAISDGSITAGHGRAIMAVEGAPAREELFGRIRRLELSVRQAEAEGVYHKKNGAFPETASSHEAAPAGRGPARRSTQVDETLADARRQLESVLGVKVAVGGSSVHGKITLKFSSEREFQELLAKLEKCGS
jgi:ParB family chromosome partitioning protein